MNTLYSVRSMLAALYLLVGPTMNEPMAEHNEWNRVWRVEE